MALRLGSPTSCSPGTQAVQTLLNGLEALPSPQSWSPRSQVGSEGPRGPNATRSPGSVWSVPWEMMAPGGQP